MGQKDIEDLCDVECRQRILHVARFCAVNDVMIQQNKISVSYPFLNSVSIFRNVATKISYAKNYFYYSDNGVLLTTPPSTLTTSIVSNTIEMEQAFSCGRQRYVTKNTNASCISILSVIAHRLDAMLVVDASSAAADLFVVSGQLHLIH